MMLQMFHRLLHTPFYVTNPKMLVIFLKEWGGENKNRGCGLSHIPRIGNYVSVELLNELLTVAGDDDALVRAVNNLTSCVVEHLLCWSFASNLFDT